MDVHPTNLHQLQDAILSIWANISKECFQHLVFTVTFHQFNVFLLNKNILSKNVTVFKLLNECVYIMKHNAVIYVK